jgi:hypothetical protein
MDYPQANKRQAIILILEIDLWKANKSISGSDKKINEMIQTTKDFYDGYFYLIPSVSILVNRNLKIYLLKVRWLHLGWTIHKRRNKHLRY